MTLSRGPSVEHMMNRHLTSAGNPHRRALSWPRWAGQLRNIIMSSVNHTVRCGWRCLLGTAFATTPGWSSRSRSPIPHCSRPASRRPRGCPNGKWPRRPPGLRGHSPTMRCYWCWTTASTCSMGLSAGPLGRRRHEVLARTHWRSFKPRGATSLATARERVPAMPGSWMPYPR